LETPEAVHPDSEVVVRPGQVLSRILAEHYGPGSARWLALVARYNGLDDPDELQAGSVLRLPDVSRLVAAELVESSP
jgi:nucleoid-associated protein YgaU